VKVFVGETTIQSHDPIQAVDRDTPLLASRPMQEPQSETPRGSPIVLSSSPPIAEGDLMASVERPQTPNSEPPSNLREAPIQKPVVRRKRRQRDANSDRQSNPVSWPNRPI